MDYWDNIDNAELAKKLEEILMAAANWHEEDCPVPGMDSVERQSVLYQAVKRLRNMSSVTYKIDYDYSTFARDEDKGAIR